MIIFRIAWLNIWRHKLRSSIVMFAVTVGLFGGLVSTAIMKGMTGDMVENSIKNQVSDIQIHNPQYPANNEIRYLIENSTDVMDRLGKVKGVEAVCQRTKIQGMASTASKAMGIIVNGIEPEKEKRVTGIYKCIGDSAGTYFTSKRRNRILISHSLAKELNAKVKSKIIITFQDYDGNLTGASFKVEGIFKTQNDMFDKQNVFVRKSDLDRILDMPANSAHEIAVLTASSVETYNVLPVIKQMFPNYLAEGWFDLSPYLEMSTSMTSYMLLIFMSIIMLALGFVIVNTMLMVVLERTRELGMIMAIGMNKKKVFTMIFYETSLLGFLGAMIGIAVSAMFVWHFGSAGLNISSFSEGFQAFGYNTVVHPMLDNKDYVEVIVMVFVTGLIASVFPTIRALKMKPVEAIRE